MEFLEFTNILDLNFEIIKHEKEFISGKCFKDYFPALDNVCVVINNEEAQITTPIQQGDLVCFTINYQGKNGAKMFLMLLLIVIITIISYGSMTGPAAAGAAGEAGAAGATMTDITLTGELVTVPATTTATTGLSSSFMLQVGMLAGSMVLNSLLAPKAPDQEDKPPEVSVYNWGDNKTQSKMMIPIPIILGKFPSFGNLLALRTEPKKHANVYDALIDIGYFQFGLSSNELSEIEDIFLSKLSIKDMGNEDIIAFYSKGTEDQSYLYAIPGKDEENETYRFPIATEDQYNNEPLKDGCPLNPGQILETVINRALAFPEHPEIGFVVPYGVTIKNLGITNELISYWSYGSLTDLPSTHDLPNYVGTPYDLYVLCSGESSTGISLVEDPSLLSFVVGDEIMCSFDDGYDPYYSYETGWVDSYRTLKGVIQEIIEYELPLDYSNPSDDIQICYGYKINVNFDYAKALVHPQASGTLTIYEDLLTSCNDGGENSCWDDRPDPMHIKPADDNWFFYNTQDSEADEITFELFLPQGLFYDMQDREDDMDYYHAFVVFEWEILYKEHSGVAYSESAFLSGLGHKLWTSPGDILAPENSPVISICQYFKAPLKYVISIFDVIEHGWTTVGSHGNQIVLEDGKLKNGLYTVKLRIQNYGNTLYFDYAENCLSTYGIILPPKEQEEFSQAYEGNEVQVNQTVLYRVKEITYTKNINYPRTSVLGFTWMASQQYNSSLPQIQALCKNKILVWDGTLDTEEDMVNHWIYKHSSNPAYICINLLFNSYYGAAISGYGATSDQNSIEFQECAERFRKRVDLNAFCEFGSYCDEPVENIGSLDKIIVPPGNNPTDPDLYGKYFNSADWLYVEAERTYYPKRFVCNGIVSSTQTIIDWLSKILGSYDATITFQGAKISIKYDKQYNPFIPLQVFTSSNIIKDSFKQTFLNPTILASRVETTFMDEDNQYTKTPVILMPTEGTGLDPNRKSNVNVFGYTQIDRVLSRLDTILRKTNYLNQIVEFATSTQGFTRRVGDPIGVQHEFIEWGVTKDHLSENILQASGRITKIAEEDEGSGVKFNIYLDRPIHIEDEDVNLVDRYIYIRSMKDDDLSFRARISGYKLVFGNTRVTIPNIDPGDELYPIWSSLDKYDLFIIGEIDDVYKEAIITDIKYGADNILTIKALVYADAIYQSEKIITDIVGNIFTPIQCKVNNCQIFEENQGLSVIWEPPELLSVALADSNKFRIDLVEYRIYRMLQTPAEGKDSGFPLSSWIHIASTTEPSFFDANLEGGSNYGYKVTTVVRINNHVALIPLSWNDECSRLLAYSQDYLDVVIPIDYGFDPAKSKLENYYDFTLVANTSSKRRKWNNMILAWSLVTDSTSTDWLGNQNIKLLDDVYVGDQYIYVDSIDGLPRNANIGTKVFGLVVINNLEIVFVTNSVEESPGRFKLTLRYYTETFMTKGQEYTQSHKYLNRRYFLGSNQPAGSKVVNAHLGFYPVLLFACQEDNNVISSTKTNIILMDSIYLYDFNNNVVKLVSPNDVQPLLIELVLNQQLYRTTSGSKNMISQVKNAGLSSDGKIALTLKFMDVSTADLDINYSYITMAGEPHKIYVAALAACPELPNLKVVNKLSSNRINFTFPDVEIPPGHQVYVALTHIYTIGENSDADARGYTSFPVLLTE